MYENTLLIIHCMYSTPVIRQKREAKFKPPLDAHHAFRSHTVAEDKAEY